MTRYDILICAATAAFVVAMFAIASEPAGGVVAALAHPSLAAWVQASGSIAAIIAVFRIQRADHTHQIMLGKLEAAESTQIEVEALNLLIAQSRVTVDNCARKSRAGIWKPDTAKYSLAQLEADLRLMDQVDFKRLPNRFVVTVYFRARQALIAARRQTEMVEAALPDQLNTDFFDAPADVLTGLTPALNPYVHERL